MKTTQRAITASICLLLAACGEEDPAAQMAGQIAQLATATATASLLVVDNAGYDSKKGTANWDELAAQLAGRLGGCKAALLAHDRGSPQIGVEFLDQCRINGYGTFLGALRIELAADGERVRSSLSLSGLEVNGVLLGGTSQISRPDTGGYRVSASLAAGGGLSSVDTALLPDGAAWLLNGKGTLGQVGMPASYTVAGLRHTLGRCYADQGKITVQPPAAPSRVVRFEANTPQTGQVVTTSGGEERPDQLPLYGPCAG